jgi:hypothetical protein
MRGTTASPGSSASSRRRTDPIQAVAIGSRPTRVHASRCLLPALVAAIAVVTCTPRTCPRRSEASVGQPIQDDARCDGTDPACGPVAFANACYDSSRRRILVYPGAAARRAKHVQVGPCDYDGQCTTSCCGCIRYQSASKDAGASRFEDSCLCGLSIEAERALKDAFCGCVAGSCQWFEQQELRRSPVEGCVRFPLAPAHAAGRLVGSKERGQARPGYVGVAALGVGLDGVPRTRNFPPLRELSRPSAPKRPCDDRMCGLLRRGRGQFRLRSRPPARAPGEDGHF